MTANHFQKSCYIQINLNEILYLLLRPSVNCDRLAAATGLDPVW